MTQCLRRFALAVLCATAVTGWAAPGIAAEDNAPTHSQTATNADAQTSDKPLWELGVGAAGAFYPDFRGSDQYNTIGFPIPTVVYRGKWLRASRGDAHARLFNSPRFNINITGAGATPADSNRANGRDGMPDLDPTFSVGPSFDWTLSDPQKRDSRLRLRIPVRAAFVASFSDFKSLGASIGPKLEYNRTWHDNAVRWTATVEVGPQWASGRFHDYYYRVKPRFARPNRPVFNPGTGYSGFRAGAGFIHKRERLSLGAYASMDYLGGTEFENSPLVQTKQAYVVGLFVAWKLWESKTRAPLLDDTDAAAE